MKHKQKTGWMGIVFILLFSSFFYACTSNIHPGVAIQPTTTVVQPVPTDMVNNEVMEDENIQYEQALEIAIQSLVEKYQLEKPNQWIQQNQVMQDQDNPGRRVYTSGAWSASIQPAGDISKNNSFNLVVDNISLGLHWEGSIDSIGSINETVDIPPVEIQSPVAARQAAVDFIVSNYQWETPGDWNEQPIKPMENAITRYTYTSGPWVVQVDVPAMAPLISHFNIIADMMNINARWTGTVKATGDIIETEYIRR